MHVLLAHTRLWHVVISFTASVKTRYWLAWRMPIAPTLRYRLSSMRVSSRMVLQAGDEWESSERVAREIQSSRWWASTTKTAITSTKHGRCSKMISAGWRSTVRSRTTKSALPLLAITIYLAGPALLISHKLMSDLRISTYKPLLLTAISTCAYMPDSTVYRPNATVLEWMSGKKTPKLL